MGALRLLGPADRHAQRMLALWSYPLPTPLPALPTIADALGIESYWRARCAAAEAELFQVRRALARAGEEWPTADREERPRRPHA